MNSRLAANDVHTAVWMDNMVQFDSMPEETKAVDMAIDLRKAGVKAWVYDDSFELGKLRWPTYLVLMGMGEIEKARKVVDG